MIIQKKSTVYKADSLSLRPLHNLWNQGTHQIVSFAVVLCHYATLLTRNGQERCVMTQRTAAKEGRLSKSLDYE